MFFPLFSPLPIPPDPALKLQESLREAAGSTITYISTVPQRFLEMFHICTVQYDGPMRLLSTYNMTSEIKDLNF